MLNFTSVLTGRFWVATYYRAATVPVRSASCEVCSDYCNRWAAAASALQLWPQLVDMSTVLPVSCHEFQMTVALCRACRRTFVEFFFLKLLLIVASFFLCITSLNELCCFSIASSSVVVRLLLRYLAKRTRIRDEIVNLFWIWWTQICCWKDLLTKMLTVCFATRRDVELNICREWRTSYMFTTTKFLGIIKRNIFKISICWSVV